LSIPFYAGLLSATALATLSLAGPVFFLVFALGIGAGQATIALVGNELGAEQPSHRNALFIGLPANIGLDPLFVFTFGLGVAGGGSKRLS